MLNIETRLFAVQGRIDETVLHAPRNAGAICILIVSASLLLGDIASAPIERSIIELASVPDPTFYLHRTTPQTPAPSPAGLRMNITAPPSAQAEATIQFNKGTNYYWYSDLLTPGCAAAGTWTFYLWADTATTLSTLDVHIDLTNTGGTNVRAIGNFIGRTITALTPTLYTITVSGSGVGIQTGDRLRLTLLPEGGGSNDSHMNVIYDGYGNETPGSETRLNTAVSFSNCTLNLRVRNWSLTDTIPGASVYVNSSIRTSSPTGWANFTSLGGVVLVKVQYFGYWVNGTFPITLDSNKTMDIRANIYDVTITIQPANRQGVIQSANVTAYNSTQYGPSGRIATGITGSNGRVTFRDVPNGTIFFVSYAKSDYSILISQSSQTVSSEGQPVSLLASQNVGGITTIPWDIYIIASIALGGGSTALNKSAKRRGGSNDSS